MLLAAAVMCLRVCRSSLIAESFASSIESSHSHTVGSAKSSVSVAGVFAVLFM